MRQAAPDKDDFNSVYDFFNLMDRLFDSRMYGFGSEDSWEEDLDEDDEDRKYMLKIRAEIAEDEHLSEDDVDNERVLFAAIKRRYLACDCSWRRVLGAGEIAIANTCDPTADTVEWHPHIERLFENSMMGE